MTAFRGLVGLFLALAGDAETGVGLDFEAGGADLLAALHADAVLVLVETDEGFLNHFEDRGLVGKATELEIVLEIVTAEVGHVGGETRAGTGFLVDEGVVAMDVQLLLERSPEVGQELLTAACVAILLGCVTILRNSLATDDAECIAFVEGHQVSTEQARNIAEADVARMEQFMQTVATQRAAEEAKVKHFINTIQR